MSHINFEIYRAIKENLWLRIEYENREKQKKNFIIGIRDLDDKYLYVDQYNRRDGYNGKTRNSNPKLLYSGIKKANAIDYTYFNCVNLSRRIEENKDNYNFLEYDYYNENLFKYYSACHREDSKFYHKEELLIDGIDVDVLISVDEHKLSDDDFLSVYNTLLNNLRNFDRTFEVKEQKLTINELSIKTSKGYYPIVYRDLLLDVKKQSLCLSLEIKFNDSFFDNNRKLRNFSKYVNMELTDFESLFVNKRSEAIDIIKSNLDKNEMIEEKPIIYNFERSFTINLTQEYDKVRRSIEENKESTPIKTFFGSPSNTKLTKNRAISLFDSNINVDQLNMIYKSITKYVNYVQGPPGTGKTSTIINLILTTFTNDETVLVSSQNNKPINDIYEKLSNIQYNDKKVIFPVLRLGRKDYIIKALEQIKEMYNRAVVETVYEKSLDRKKDLKIKSMSKVVESLEKRDKVTNLKNTVSNHKKLLLELEEDYEIHVKLETLTNQLEEELKIHKDISDDELLEMLDFDFDDFYIWLYYKSASYIQKLDNTYYSDLKRIILNIDNNDTDTWYTEFTSYIKVTSNLKKLLNIFPVILSTNLSVIRLGDTEEIFDLVVIDEAGQSNISTSIPVLARGSRALLVGDPSQLRPITTISDRINNKLMNSYGIDDFYNYKDNSIIDCMEQVDNLSNFILLREHYRSHKNIINFSNKLYYGEQLVIKSDSDSKNPLNLIDVKTKSSLKNASMEEVRCVINEIENSSYKHKDIGVITPFVKQKNLLELELKKKGINCEVGTVHTFQGSQKEMIIFTLAVTDNTHPRTFEWVKNNVELINVATTRAKENLTLITDYNALETLSDDNNDLLQLANYIKDKGEYELKTVPNEEFISKCLGLKGFNTKSEKELLQTLNHYATVNKKVKIHTKNKFCDHFEIDELDNKDYYKSCHLDFVITNHQDDPLLAIELNGSSHNSDKAIYKDKLKREMCNRRKLRLITLDNSYSRRYNYIKDLIENVIKR